MGLAFKPDIDDLRESPALEIAHHLSTQPGVQLLCVEPHVEKAPHNLPLVSPQEAIERADLVVYLVAHTQFKTLQERPTQRILDICGLGKVEN
jgi:UDP-N-acetyl-D-mannosaminuronic acid dehydrogenase